MREPSDQAKRITRMMSRVYVSKRLEAERKTRLSSGGSGGWNPPGYFTPARTIVFGLRLIPAFACLAAFGFGAYTVVDTLVQRHYWAALVSFGLGTLLLAVCWLADARLTMGLFVIGAILLAISFTVLIQVRLYGQAITEFVLALAPCVFVLMLVVIWPLRYVPVDERKDTMKAIRHSWDETSDTST